MKKIAFLLLIFAFLLSLFVMGDRNGAMAQTIELKFAHFMAPVHVQHQKSFVPFAEKVNSLSGGQVKVNLYPGGALGGPTQLPDAVKTGITDIAFIIPSYTTARFPRTSAFDLPFLFDSGVHATKVCYDLYDKYLAEDYRDYKVLWLYSCGPGQLHSATKRIHILDELQGMKMRTPSAYMTKALKLLGTNPIGMPISELTVALQKKVVDGMLTPWSAVEDFKMWDLISYLTELDMYISPMAVVMNKERFNALPESAKKAIEEASGKPWGLHAAKVYDEHDENSIRKNQETKKIEVYKLPASERQKFMERVKGMEADWVAEVSKAGLPGKAILDAVHESAQKNR